MGSEASNSVEYLHPAVDEKMFLNFNASARAAATFPVAKITSWDDTPKSPDRMERGDVELTTLFREILQTYVILDSQ